MDLDVSAQIETASGWLVLEDAVNGYELHKESFNNRAVTWRKQDVSSDWLEGTYTNHAVRGNVIEPVAVYVTAATPYALSVKMDALTDALGQIQYGLKVRFGDLEETWTCFPADYAVEAGQELRFATMALVRAQIPHLPTITKAQVVP